DVFRVEWGTDAGAHRFVVYLNDQVDAALSDPGKLQGNTATQYAGILVHGNTIDGIDDFSLRSSSNTDSEAPAAITDLSITAVTASSVELTWTATGDDGATGLASAYDLRYSTAPINDGNFSSATPIVGLGNPSFAGTVETFIAGGLQSGTHYYFAMRASDEAENTSELSNVVDEVTASLVTTTDEFNRAGTALGANWAADSRLQVISGEVRHTATVDIWSTAVFKNGRNAQEVSIKWGNGATTFGANFAGILVMVNDFTATPNGYLIQHYTQAGRTRLYHIQNGNVDSAPLINEGQAFGPAPQAGSVMTVSIRQEEDGHYFDVYIDGQFDRTLADTQKRENGTYCGFALESTLGAENAITRFSAGYAPSNPKSLQLVSGNNQSGRVGQKLAQPLRVKLVDDFDNPVVGAEVKFEATSGQAFFSKSDDNIRLEAENAQVTAPLTTVNDTAAAGGKYVAYPNPQAEAGAAVFSFEVKTAGTYYIWTRSLTPGASGHDSWTVSVDGANAYTYDVFQGSRSNVWAWDQLSQRGNGQTGNPQFDPKTYDWEAGAHTITFQGRAHDARLDKILITNDPDYVPEGKEESGTLTDNNGIAAAEVTIGNQVGPVVVEARFGTLVPAIFNLTARPALAGQMALASGNNQSGPAGQPLAQPFVVTVADEFGNPVPDGEVGWVVIQGNGQLSSYLTKSDASGQAAVVFTPGNSGAANSVEARAAFTNQVITFSATTTAGIATQIASVSGNDQSGSAGSPLTQPLIVRVNDANGEAVGRFPVEFVTLRGGGKTTGNNPILNPSFQNESNGLPADWTLEGSPTTQEVKIFENGGRRALLVEANRAGVGVSQAVDYATNGSYTLYFSAKVDSGILRVTWRMNDAGGNIQDKIIDVTPAGARGDFTLYSLTATNGLAVRRSLFFRTQDAGKFYLDDVKVVPNTGNDGRVAATWTLGDTAGTQQVQAVGRGNNGNLTGAPVLFSANAIAGAAARLREISGNNQLASAGQPAPPLIVQVTDNFGNGVPGVNVLFQVTVGGGSLNNGNSSVTVASDANGLAGAVLTLGANAGIDNTARASANGLAGSPINFTVRAAIPSNLDKISGEGQITTAGTAAPQPLIVRVSDTGDNAIAGVAVTFSVVSGGGTINGASSAEIRTNTQGEALAVFVAGPTAGSSSTVRATAVYNNQPLQGSPRQFVIRSAALREMALVSGNNQSGVAGDPLVNPFKVSLLDTLNHGVPQQEVTFTVIEGNGKLNGTASTLAIKTDSTGAASVKLTLGNLPGTNNNKVRAQAATNVNGSPIVFQASAGIGAPFVLKKVSGDSLSAVVNNPVAAPFVVKVTDKVDNPLANVEVIFEVIAGGGSLNGVIKDTINTNANGVAQATLTVGNTSGLYNNQVRARAFNGTLELNNSPLVFRVSATPTRARSMSLIAGQRQSGRAGEALAQPLRVRVADGQNNPVPGHGVRFQSSGVANGTFANGVTRDTTVISDVNGIAQIVWVLGGAVLPDSQVVTASANDGVQGLQGSPVKFAGYAAPGLPNATGSSITANSPVPANGQAKANVTVTVRDKFGNAISNRSVKLIVSGTLNDIVQPSNNTDAQGRATGTVASTKAETKLITALVDDIYELNIGTPVRFEALAAAQIVAQSGNNQTGNINTALLQPLNVRIEDDFRNGVRGITVSFSVDAGGGRISGPASVVSDSNGVAGVMYILGQNRVENRIRAVSTGLRNSPVIFVANAVNQAARKLVAASGNNQTGVILENLPRPLIVRATDQNDRPVFGAAVNFEVTFGGGQVNGGPQAFVNTDEFGEASVIWRLGNSAGTNVVRVTSGNLTGSPLDFQAQAQTGAPANLVLQSGNGAAGVVNQDLVTPLVVRVTDTNNNGVDGVPVFFELIQGTGQLLQNVVFSANGGFASTRISFGSESGDRRVRASAQSLNGSPLFFTVTARAAIATTMRAVARTNNQRGTTGLPLNFPLQVKITDNFGNPISGVSVDFLVKRGGGNLGGSPTATVASNEQGIAEVPWTVGAGRNEAEALSAGLRNSPLQFVATGVTGNNFPIFVDLQDQGVREGDRIELILNATDADNDPVRYGATNLPPGAVFDSLGTRIFTWKTDEASAGRYEVSFFAYDNRGGADEELVIIEVANVNRPPVIVSRSPQGTPGVWPDTSFAGGTITMRVVAQDPDNDVLSYRWLVNNQMTNNIASTFVFGSEIKWNYVEAWVFDQSDTVRTLWSIKTPVQMQAFTATTIARNRIQLDWQTAAEINSAGFDVLRSRSRSGDYERINSTLVPVNKEGRYSYVDTEVQANERYYYQLEEIDLQGNTTLHGPISATASTPLTFELQQNYPNPFNPTTNISYSLPRDVQVKLTVYNLLGQRVRELVNEVQKAGFQTQVWDGRDDSGKALPSGLYHYRIEAGDFVAVRRMTLMK
ncbi:MAG: Ig-like domain-containing protein, partial [bacterium]